MRPHTELRIVCPFTGCEIPITTPNGVKLSRPVIDTRTYMALVDVAQNDEAVREAAWTHLEQHHPDLLVPPGNPTADPGVSPDAARWRPDHAETGHA